MNVKTVALLVLALIAGIAVGFIGSTAITPSQTKTVTQVLTRTEVTTIVQTVTSPVTFTTVVPTTLQTTLRETITTVVEKVETVIKEWPRVIVDALGREVKFDKPPSRVVSTMPSITEKIFALGLGDIVVGVDSYSNYPPEVPKLVKEGKITDVGGPWSLNLESIAALRPDLVILCRGVSEHELDFGPKLEELGLKTFFLICNAAKNQYDIYMDLRTLSKIFGVEDRAENVIKDIENRIEEISKKLVNVSKPKVLILLGPPSWGLFSCGGDTFINWLIVTAGGINIASTYSGWPMLSYEFILVNDPDVIIVTAYGFEPKQIYNEIAGSPLANTTAWKKGKVYLLMDEANDVVNRPSPRISLALEILAKIIHPEIFGEITRSDVVNIAKLS